MEDCVTGYILDMEKARLFECTKIFWCLLVVCATQYDVESVAKKAENPSDYMLWSPSQSRFKFCIYYK